MSVMSSTIINISVSETSLGSSAMLTASSMNASSDDDYETSSEFHSPRVNLKENSDISQCSSNILCTAKYNRVISSESNPFQLDQSKDSDVSFESNGYVFSIKSNTSLSQHKVISDLMNDMLRVSENNSYEQNSLIIEQETNISIESQKSEIRMTPDIPSIYNDDLNIQSSLNVIEKNSTNNFNIMNYNTVSKISIPENIEPLYNEYKIEHQDYTSFKESNCTVYTPENTAQVNSNLFLKPEELIESFSDYTSPRTILESNQVDQHEETLVDMSLRKLQLNRKSQINNTIKSILRIDTELQPLNLMLSKLLAEFRVMFIENSSGYIYPNYYNPYFYGSENFVLHQFKYLEPEDQFPNSMNIMNENMMLNKKFQTNLTSNHQIIGHSDILYFRDYMDSICFSSDYSSENYQKNYEIIHNRTNSDMFNYCYQDIENSYNKDISLR
jgi:hypothetical protein